MNSIEKTINDNKMFNQGEIIGVACSGGEDSMCLLHFLFTNKNLFGIDVLAINVDHSIRDNSADDSTFVSEYCQKNNIKCYSFKVDALKYADDNKIGEEEAARIVRYKVFDAALKKGLCDKVAIAHHLQDQVETILLNIFRGAGLKGASGINPIQGKYVRPLINTQKSEILSYIKNNNIPFVTDQTNYNNNYSRNFLRNEMLPSLRKHWKNVDNNIINFSNICKQDDYFIESQINYDDIIFNKKIVQIPLTYFNYPESIQYRVLMHCFSLLGLSKDIEKRHLRLLLDLVKTGKNCSKLNLPNKIKASLEYDYLTLSLPLKSSEFTIKDFKLGITQFDNITASIKKSTKFNISEPNCHLIDAKLLPQNAKWRTRQNGDIFTKFGGGEKKLKDYFIDKKIPLRMRNQIPVLADKNIIYCVLGYEISDKVKITETTKSAYIIKYYKKDDLNIKTKN